MPRAKGSFEVMSWDEKPYEHLEGGAKLTRASVSQTFTGDVEGDGSVQWLMSYRHDGTAHFVGLQRVTGTVRDRKGSFVLETTGTFDGKEAQGKWAIVGGTGDLETMRGTGEFRAPMGPEASYDLTYELG